MELNDYLTLQRELYLQGVLSQETPELMHDFGGALALAAIDAQDIRVEKNGLLGFIDRLRNWSEKETIASMRWSGHSRNIRELAKRNSIDDAMAEYVWAIAKTNSRVPIEMVQNMTTMVMRSGSSGARWICDIEAVRAEIARGANVMTDTLPALVAGTDYLVSGDWGEAIAAGEFARPFTQLLGATSQLRQAQGYTPPQTRSTKPEILDIRAKNTIRSSPPQNTVASRATAGNGVSDRGILDRPHSVQRSTLTTQSPPPRNSKPRPVSPQERTAFAKERTQPKTTTRTTSRDARDAISDAPISRSLGELAIPSAPVKFSKGGVTLKSWFSDVFVGTSQARYREELKSLLQASPQHPFSKALLENGDFVSKPKHSTMADWKAEPRMWEAGHVGTAADGYADVIVIQSVYRNQLRSAKLERVGSALSEFALVIGNIAIDRMTAWDLVDAKRLDPVVVRNAQLLPLVR